MGSVHVVLHLTCYGSYLLFTSGSCHLQLHQLLSNGSVGPSLQLVSPDPSVLDENGLYTNPSSVALEHVSHALPVIHSTSQPTWCLRAQLFLTGTCGSMSQQHGHEGKLPGGYLQRSGCEHAQT